MVDGLLMHWSVVRCSRACVQEWSSAYSLKFGIVRVDCVSKDLTRYVKRSAQFYSEYILQARGYGNKEQLRVEEPEVQVEEVQRTRPTMVSLFKSQ